MNNDELELDYRTIAVDEGVDLYPDTKVSGGGGRLIPDSSSEESLNEYS